MERKTPMANIFFFIDDDNVIDKNCIKELVKIMQSDDKIGNAGPLMYYFAKDSIMFKCYGKLHISFDRNYFESNFFNQILQNNIAKR